MGTFTDLSQGLISWKLEDVHVLGERAPDLKTYADKNRGVTNARSRILKRRVRSRDRMLLQEKLALPRLRCHSLYGKQRSKALTSVVAAEPGKD